MSEPRPPHRPSESDAPDVPWGLLVLAVGGYLYMFGVAVAVAAFAVAATWLFVTNFSFLFLKSNLKLVLGLLGFAGGLFSVAVRMLFIRLPDPSGLVVTRERCPALFGELDRLGRRLGTGPVDEVLVDSGLNCGVVQLPRFGPFPLYRTTLVVGLPLTQALSPDQFRAVLAHELAHVSRGHPSGTAFIYRSRLGWAALLRGFEATDGRGALLFLPFLRWFVPRFFVDSFPVARAAEYTADRLAARHIAPQHLVDALVALDLVVARVKPRPDGTWGPTGPMAHITETMRSPADPEVAGAVLRQLEADRGDPGDSHPPTRARAAALGVPLRVPPVLERTASEHFLGPALPGLVNAVEAGVAG